MARNDKVILIAGGAGSIGSALAMHLGRAGCDDLLLVDECESALEETRQRLSEKAHCNPVCLVANLCNLTHLNKICSNAKPDIFINAAARKNVWSAQRNIAETVKNNLTIVQNILKVRHLSGNESQVLHISTDKAIEPSSVMGASKMLCESMIREAYPQSNNRNRIVRFGNVKDTNGSVFRIWERQYAEGVPLTVTDLKMKRWMMSMDDACEQILRVLGLDAGTYVLDMGVMYSVGDMLQMFLDSKDLRDYPTNFVGKKPGEKLEEKLFWEQEQTKIIECGGKKLSKITNSPSFPYSKALSASEGFDDETTLKCLQRMFGGLVG